MTDDFSFINFPNLNNDDVILFSEKEMARFCNIKKACQYGLSNGFSRGISSQLSNYNVNINIPDLINSGVECEILTVGAHQWKKAKVRIKMKLEFIPDNLEMLAPESPLDDIRRKIYQKQ